MQALGIVWSGIYPFPADLDEVHTVLPAPGLFGARLLLNDWTQKDAQGGFVVGRDVPSRTLGPVLRNLALYETLDSPADFRVRVAGTAYIRRFGRDVTGLKLSEIYSVSQFERRRAALDAVIAAAAPAIVQARVGRDARVVLEYEALDLPVWSPGRAARWVLGGVFYPDWGG
jgi:hypothetical protein